MAPVVNIVKLPPMEDAAKAVVPVSVKLTSLLPVLFKVMAPAKAFPAFVKVIALLPPPKLEVKLEVPAIDKAPVCVIEPPLLMVAAKFCPIEDAPKTSAPLLL